MTRQGQPRGSDVCKCGHTRSEHLQFGGIARYGVQHCPEFRFARRATVAERKQWMDAKKEKTK